MKLLAASVAALAVLAGCASGARSDVVGFCTGKQLSGTFNVIRGSAGAGNIVYRLVVKNTSTSACTLTGLPRVRLFGRTGKALPTKVTPAFRPGLTAVLVHLDPGAFAHATARFSPDVPGVGEGNRRQCEPKAYTLHVTSFGATFVAPVKPVTPVCSHGALQLSVYSPGR